MKNKNKKKRKNNSKKYGALLILLLLIVPIMSYYVIDYIVNDVTKPIVKQYYKSKDNNYGILYDEFSDSIRTMTLESFEVNEDASIIEKEINNKNNIYSCIFFF